MDSIFIGDTEGGEVFDGVGESMGGLPCQLARRGGDVGGGPAHMCKAGKAALRRDPHVHPQGGVAAAHAGHEVLEAVQPAQADVVDALRWIRGIQRRDVGMRAVARVDEFLPSLPDEVGVVDDGDLAPGGDESTRAGTDVPGPLQALITAA